MVKVTISTDYMTMSLLNYYYYGLIIFPTIHKWIITKPIKNIKENIENYQVEVTQCHHQGIRTYTQPTPILDE